MKFGPTSANLLPARIVWCASQASKDKLAALLSDTNADKIAKAPVTAIIAMDLKFYEHGPKLFPHADVRPWFEGSDAAILDSAFRNSSLQGAYFIIAARSIGLDAGPVSGFDNAAVDDALGYGDPSTIFDRLPRPDFAEFNTLA